MAQVTLDDVIDSEPRPSVWKDKTPTIGVSTTPTMGCPANTPRPRNCALVLLLLQVVGAWVSRSPPARSSRLNVLMTSDMVVEDRQLRFAGVSRLYSDAELLDRLSQTTVAVIGLGGVGSWSAEALCRSGVGHLVLVDLDEVCISNTNRQLHALSSTVGQMKIDAMKQRLLDINPDCNITLVHDFISTVNVRDLLEAVNADCVLDAIDGSREKAALLAACTDLKTTVVTVGGAAGRRDPTLIACNDIVHVESDKLLRTCRKELRKYYGFPAGLSFRERQKRKVRKWNIDCVYSAEEPKQVDQRNNRSFRRCDGALGTAAFVTGTFGLIAAGRIVDKIACNQLKGPRR